MQITGHKGPAVGVIYHSVLFAAGPDEFSQNGDSALASGAAIVVLGSSHALMQGATIASTPGPAILAELGSTVRLSQMTFTADTGGPIHCDSSSYMWTDVTHANSECNVPSPPQAPAVQAARHSIPDTMAIRERQAQYKKLAGASTGELNERQP